MPLLQASTQALRPFWVELGHDKLSEAPSEGSLVLVR